MSAAKKLVSFVHVDGEVYGPDNQPPADVAKQITNPNAWSGGSEEKETGSDNEPAAYSKQKVEDLETEVEKRGLTVEGSGKDGKVVKADLVAALEADDA